MKSLNRVELKGALGQDPQINNVDGRNVANCSLATELAWKDRNGEWQKDVTWHNVCAWEGFGIAELNRLHKGTKVHVIGRLRTRRYTDKQGVEKYITEVLAEELDIIDEPTRDYDPENTGAPSPRVTNRMQGRNGGSYSRQRSDSGEDF